LYSYHHHRIILLPVNIRTKGEYEDLHEFAVHLRVIYAVDIGLKSIRTRYDPRGYEIHSHGSTPSRS
jgi:Tfp pilus assembly protein PilO